MREVIQVRGMDRLVFEKSTDPEKLSLGVQHANADGQVSPPDFVELSREESLQVARMLLDHAVEPAVFVSYDEDRAPLPALRQLSEMQAAGEKVEKGGVSNVAPIDQIDTQDSARAMAAVALLKGLRATMDQLTKPPKPASFIQESLKRCVAIVDEVSSLLGVHEYGTHGRRGI